MRLGFGWAWERTDPYWEGGTPGRLLSRRDALSWRWGWERRLLRLRHPVRAARWKRYGAALYDLFEGGVGGKFSLDFSRMIGRLFDLVPADTPFLTVATEGGHFTVDKVGNVQSP